MFALPGIFFCILHRCGRMSVKTNNFVNKLYAMVNEGDPAVISVSAGQKSLLTTGPCLGLIRGGGRQGNQTESDPQIDTRALNIFVPA